MNDLFILLILIIGGSALAAINVPVRIHLKEMHSYTKENDRVTKQFNEWSGL